jgi:uncharacterized protein YqgQ
MLPYDPLIYRVLKSVFEFNLGFLQGPVLTDIELREKNVQEIYEHSIFSKPKVYTVYNLCLRRLLASEYGKLMQTKEIQHAYVKLLTIKMLEIEN